MWYLHSNMVRFIISFGYYRHFCFSKIYIPIWLDLLLRDWHDYEIDQRNLHSNMVRFIINIYNMSSSIIYIFTFQYG